MISKIPIQYIVFIIVIVFASSIFLASNSGEMVFAKKDKDDNKEKDKDQLVVNARLNLNNLDMKNTEFIRLTAFINGEDFKQDIPISSIDKSKKNFDVELKTLIIAL